MGRTEGPAFASRGKRKRCADGGGNLVDNGGADRLVFSLVPPVCEEQPRKVRSIHAASCGKGSAGRGLKLKK